MNLRKNKAFSLFEVVCSVAFLTGGFLVAAHLMSQIVSYSSKTKRLLEGVNNTLVLLETGKMGFFVARGQAYYGLHTQNVSNKYTIPFKKTVVSWKGQGDVREITFLTYKGASSYEK